MSKNKLPIVLLSIIIVVLLVVVYFINNKLDECQKNIVNINEQFKRDTLERNKKIYNLTVLNNKSMIVGQYYRINKSIILCGDDKLNMHTAGLVGNHLQMNENSTFKVSKVELSNNQTLYLIDVKITKTNSSISGEGFISGYIKSDDFSSVSISEFNDYYK